MMNREENKAVKVSNSTLAKLDRNEIGFFGLAGAAIWTYRGELKTRYNKMKRQEMENGFFFEGTNHLRVEFVKIVSDEEGVDHWAGRIFNTEKNVYEEYGPGVYGCNFFRI